ncbi:hypothetical protein KUTeg_005592 [Tegillarca granosa]|uniref:Methyltransferase type 11 domain-containing protein n=1 Tax=Tegillarca granosa TaxID=220873 RepID=A0ABQ9FK66_TEGGR|nr:hypothetical protein KUTeg_005592 [Tegillarca granosa]
MSTVDFIRKLSIEDVQAYETNARVFKGGLSRSEIKEYYTKWAHKYEELNKRGFKDIDALDPAEGMLEKAKKKNIYNKLLCEFMTEEKLPIDQGYYDCVVSSGGFGDGHIPIEALYEMIRIVKPGGIIVIAMREEYLENVESYKDKLEPLMKKMEENGLWKKIDRYVMEEYAFSKTGVIFVYMVS